MAAANRLDMEIASHFLACGQVEHRVTEGQRCRKPSWLENIDLPGKKAIECENIDQKYSLIRRLCWWLELRAARISKSVRKLVAVLQICTKLRMANFQINWFRRAILSTKMSIPKHHGSNCHAARL